MFAAFQTVAKSVWLVIGLAAAVGAGGGLLLRYKVNQAAAHPILAQARVMAAVNPDIEIVSTDEANGTMTFRDKKSGKTVSLDTNAVLAGKVKILEKNGRHLNLDAFANNETGAMRIKASDGSLIQFGEALGELPGWVPWYPGALPETTFAMRNSRGDSGSFGFQVQASLGRVVEFYSKKLQESGFQPRANLLGKEGNETGVVITAADAARQRTVLVSAGTRSAGGTSVNVTYTTK